MRKYEIAPEELSAFYTGISRPTIIDIRTKKEFVEGCIEGSINVPFNEVNYSKIAELKREFCDKTLFVLCEVGIMSKYIVKELEKFNMENAYSISGGMHACVKVRSIPITARLNKKHFYLSHFFKTISVLALFCASYFFKIFSVVGALSSIVVLLHSYIRFKTKNLNSSMANPVESNSA